MKKSYTIVIALLISFSIYSQVPTTIKYQAVIRNNQEKVLAEEAVKLTIKIVKKGSSEVYSEFHNVTTNQFGLVNLEVGSDDPNAFSKINWSQGGFQLVVELGDVLIGTNDILTVPYAMHAKTAESVTGGINELDPTYTSSEAANITADDITNLGNLSNNLNAKVDTVSGKGLSTNDFTTAEKTKLAAISGTNTGDQNLSSYATINMANKNITNLADPLNPQDAATKAYVDVLLLKIEAFEKREAENLLASGFTDSRDDNHYNVVKIGDQLWMAENLKYLPSVVSPTTGSNTIPCYYVYGYSDTIVANAKATANYATYGVLYNWQAAMADSAGSITNPSGVQGVCPTGWHLPSDTEWIELTNYLGGISVAGGKLKEVGTSHWFTPNIGATNETGFTALPGGRRGNGNGGEFGDLVGNGYWWSATEGSATNAYDRVLYYNTSIVYRHIDSKKELGFSVRCIRD